MGHSLSTIRKGAGHGMVRRDGFQFMMIAMMLPLIVGAVAGIVSGFSGFIESAFMEMTLKLEGFDYAFGPAECDGEWKECGNATFESYERTRELAIVLFIIALVAVAVKDMLQEAFNTNDNKNVLDLQAGNSMNLPAMMRYSVLVFVFLFLFPPLWDAMSGTMNNLALWIMNPHYGFNDNDSLMCAAGESIDIEELKNLAPYVLSKDHWAVYNDEEAYPGVIMPFSGPKKDNPNYPQVPGADKWIPASHSEATNYIITDSAPISNACLNDINSCPRSSATPPYGVSDAGRNTANHAGTSIGDVLCDPKLRVSYIFYQALSVTESYDTNPEAMAGILTGGGTHVLTLIMTQMIKSSTTLQVIMITFMTGVMINVVTAFALSILPIVPFYKFLPGSKKVQLGEYSNAVYALLAMPMVAAVVVVAGSGAVATMGYSDDLGLMQTFFTWLAALSVVLLVIALPTTMIPLIASAQGQATAAVMTGVQTAQFAGSVAASSIGGAVLGRRDLNEMKALSMDSGMMKSGLTSRQQERYNQLKEMGINRKMTMAQAVSMGARQGAGSQMFTPDGKMTSGFKNVMAPNTMGLREGVKMLTKSNIEGMDDGGLTKAFTDAGTGLGSHVVSEVGQSRVSEKERQGVEDDLKESKKRNEKEGKEQERVVSRAKKDLLSQENPDVYNAAKEQANEQYEKSSEEMNTARAERDAGKNDVNNLDEKMRLADGELDDVTKKLSNGEELARKTQADLYKLTRTIEESKLSRPEYIVHPMNGTSMALNEGLAHLENEEVATQETLKNQLSMNEELQEQQRTKRKNIHEYEAQKTEAERVLEQREKNLEQRTEEKKTWEREKNDYDYVATEESLQADRDQTANLETNLGMHKEQLGAFMNGLGVAGTATMTAMQRMNHDRISNDVRKAQEKLERNKASISRKERELRKSPGIRMKESKLRVIKSEEKLNGINEEIDELSHTQKQLEEEHRKLGKSQRMINAEKEREADISSMAEAEDKIVISLENLEISRERFNDVNSHINKIKSELRANDGLQRNLNKLLDASPIVMSAADVAAYHSNMEKMRARLEEPGSRKDKETLAQLQGEIDEYENGAIKAREDAGKRRAARAKMNEAIQEQERLEKELLEQKEVLKDHHDNVIIWSKDVKGYDGIIKSLGEKGIPRMNDKNDY